MILRELHRFFRRNAVIVILANIIIGIGFIGSVLSSTVSRTLSGDLTDASSVQHTATIAEASGQDGLQSVSWETVERLRDSAGGFPAKLIPYTEATIVELHSTQLIRSISVAGTSQAFFSAFGNGLSAGTVFTSFDDGPNSPKEVIISWALADTIFGSAPQALNRPVLLNGQQYRVVGVAQKLFHGLWSPTDAWVAPGNWFTLTFEFGSPQSSVAPDWANSAWKKAPFLYVLVKSALNASTLDGYLSALLQKPDLASRRLRSVNGITNDPAINTKLRSWASLGAFLAHLLIVTAALNYSGVLFARSISKMEEVRLKRVLGASSLRLAFENMIGPVLSLMFTMVIANICCFVLLSFIIKHQYLPNAIFSVWPYALSYSAYNLIFVLVIAIGIALVPTIRLLRDRGVPQNSYTTTHTRRASFTLQCLVALELGSFILTCALAGATFHSVRSLNAQQLGFKAEGLMVAETDSLEADGSFQFVVSSDGDFPLSRLVQSIVNSEFGGLPSGSVSSASCAPFSRPMKSLLVQPVDSETQSVHTVKYCVVTQNFFETLKNPIISGTGFSTGGSRGDAAEVIVNEAMASELWQDKSAVQDLIQIKQPALDLSFTARVVGVSANMRLAGPNSSTEPTIFLPLKGALFSLAYPLSFIARNGALPSSLQRVVHDSARVLTPSLGVVQSYSVIDRLTKAEYQLKMRAYAAVGSLLLMAAIACLGLYGMLSFMVATRRRELAIKSCFGASRWMLSKDILVRAVTCFAMAIAISILSLKPTQILVSQWVEESDFSWNLMFGAVLICFACIVTVASFPAFEASKTSPAELLRESE
ncbi:MAG: ABC transporter permease [Pyrinomonadaceae bacterium]